MVHFNENEDILGDIEDLFQAEDALLPSERYHNNTESVTWRPRKSVSKKNNQNNSDDPNILEKMNEEQLESSFESNEENKNSESIVPLAQQSIIPGTQKIYIKTWGCTHNNSDSEYMAGQLASYGYKLVNDKSLADLWILNSCTVKSPSEDTFRNEIELARRCGKYVVVAGCVPQGAPKSEYLKGLSVIGVQQIDRVLEVVEETLKGNTVRLLQTKKTKSGRRVAGASLSLPKIRRNPLIEIIAINSGCLNQCTYCKTKHARGDLASYPPDEIVARAIQAYSEGCCEIWLTSEDTGAYGRDIGYSLPQLLWSLVDIIPKNCRLRIGMTNPPYILEHLDDIVDILRHPRVYAFLHVPVQSGSDAVLADMKREYNRTDFEHVVDFVKQKVPQITIATDIICGFPTETEEDFDETLILCTKYQFPSLFINQFFPRPGTPAARLPRIPPHLVKERTKRLTDLFNSYLPYAGREGMEYWALVTEISHDQQYYVAHNKSYEQILLPKRPNLLGAMVKVRITSVTKFSMHAELLEEDETKWARHKAGPVKPATKLTLENLRKVTMNEPKLIKVKPSTQRQFRFLLLTGLVVFLLQWFCCHYGW